MIKAWVESWMRKWTTKKTTTMTELRAFEQEKQKAKPTNKLRKSWAMLLITWWAFRDKSEMVS